MRKFFAILTICAAMLIVAGCANIKVSKGEWKAEYTRWFNQKLDEVLLDIDPNGAAHITIRGQLSDTQIAFRLGQMSVGVGGDK